MHNFKLPWCFLFGHQKLSATQNMSLDEVLFYRVRNTSCPAIVRFYSWAKASISIGYLQKTTDINLQSCLADDISVVRRMTGGRAVYHYDDVNLSLIVKLEYLYPAKSKLELFQLISRLLMAVFEPLGLKLHMAQDVSGSLSQPDCFLTSAIGELQDELGIKRVGTALLIRDDVLWMQSSIPIQTTCHRLADYLNVDNPKSLTFLKKQKIVYDWSNVFSSQRQVDKTQYLAQQLQHQWTKFILSYPASLDVHEMLKWRRLQKDKYAHLQWNHRD